MQCPRCHYENVAGAKVCAACGSSLRVNCVVCATELPVNARFCLACGHPVGAPVPEQAPVPPPDRPSTSSTGVSGSAPGPQATIVGERKLVTVLFADIKGSTEIVAGMDPEHAEQLIRPYVGIMSDAVRRYEGTVNQVRGDGIMALFGAPVAHEDHAVRAGYAALAMVDDLRDYGQGIDQDSDPTIEIRVGIHSGEVVVRSYDNDLSVDYTAIGETVHLAARMEQLAAPGCILMTATTLAMAEGLLQVAPLGLMPVRGIPDPVDVYQVLGIGTVRSRLEAAAARGLTRFVGRDSELADVCTAHEQAGHGKGQAVALVGEAGVGKSRLFWEFVHSFRLHGWLLLESSSASYASVTPFLNVVDLLKAYFGIDARDDPATVQRKVTERLARLDLKASAPALLSTLAVPVDDDEWRSLDPPQRKRRTLEALTRLLHRESLERPVCVAVEDLHWIDSETQAFLDGLIESLSSSRILLLVNYRPEYSHAWSDLEHFTEIRVDPLSVESAAELLGMILGSDEALLPLKRALISQTECNPFFIEESVRSLVEAGALSGTRGDYRIVDERASMQAPATVQAVLAARVDRLPTEEKRLLQTAAVIGRDFSFALLQEATGDAEETLKARLDLLRDAEFIYEASLFPEREYTFKHGLTYQVAYTSLLQQHRRALHVRILDALERYYPDRVVENVEQLGRHALHGGQWDKALMYLWRAGTKVASRSAHGEAVRSYELALTALANLPDSRETMEKAIDLRCELRNSLWATGRFEEILTHLGDAERQARQLGDRRRGGWTSVYMSASLWQVGRTEEARAAAAGALAVAEDLDDLELDVAARFYLGCSHVTSNDCRTAEPLFQRISERLSGERVRDRCGMPFLPSVVARSWLVWALAERGAFPEAVAHGEDALKIAERAGQPFSRAHIYYDLGYLYDVMGAFPEAIDALERSLALVRKWNLTYASPFITGFLGHAYLMDGRIEDGLGLLQKAHGDYQTMGLGLFRSLIGIQLGEGLMLADRLADARTVTEQSVELARSRLERGHEAYGLRVLGQVAEREEPADLAAAERHLGAALALAQSLEMRPLEAHCHADLAQVVERQGRRAEAGDHRRRAEGLYREMDMDPWLDRFRDEVRALR